MKNYYLDPKLLLNEAVRYSIEKNSNSSHRMPESFAKMLWLMATNVIKGKDFVMYPDDIKDDMVATAVANLIERAHKFDPERSSSAFSFFTQAIYFSFIGMLKAERKQMMIKLTCQRAGIPSDSWFKNGLQELEDEVGKAHASKIYREITQPKKSSTFLKKGGTLTAKRKRFNTQPISQLFDLTLDEMGYIEIWI